MNEDSVFKPKKRIFMALTSISAVLGALMFYVVWKVTFPGLYEISRFLPIVFSEVSRISRQRYMAICLGITILELRLLPQSSATVT